MTFQEKNEDILNLLRVQFSEAENFESGRTGMRMTSDFFVRFDKQLLRLSITDECYEDNEYEVIKDRVARECITLMRENPNRRVVLFASLRTEVKDDSQ
ncbi:hypothetical protein [Vibrio tubiashii]|uniref:hypothetical protein n=1 Tax=Vibrio tubiashii TaxID=29498 RepID=UPI00349EB016